MPLESIIRAHLIVDEGVRNIYNKVAASLESNKISRYLAGAAAGGLGIAAFALGSHESLASIAHEDNVANKLGVGLYALIVFGDFVSNFSLFNHYSRKEGDPPTYDLMAECWDEGPPANNDNMSIDPFEEGLHKYWVGGKIVRLAQLGIATKYLVAAGVDAYQHYGEGIVNLINAGGENLAVGVGLIGISTSMYLKDTDKDLGLKKPIWEQIYDKCKNAVEDLRESFTPKPQPIRIPADYKIH